MPKIEFNFTQAKLNSFVESTCANHPIPLDGKDEPLHTPQVWTRLYWIGVMKRDNLVHRRKKAGDALQIDNNLIT